MYRALGVVQQPHKLDDRSASRRKCYPGSVAGTTPVPRAAGWLDEQQAGAGAPVLVASSWLHEVSTVAFRGKILKASSHWTVFWTTPGL